MSYLKHMPVDAHSSAACAPSQPMDPNLRLHRFGPIRPMDQRPSLLERLLFG